MKRSRNVGIGGDVVVHDLDDDLPAEVGLAGQIDPAHAAFAEQADRFVSSQKDAALHERVTHSRVRIDAGVQARTHWALADTNSLLWKV